MRSLQTTLFLLAMIVLSTQTFRHVYVKWFEPTGSVLDEFRSPVERDILASKSLAELKALYATAYGDKNAFEREKSMQEIDLARRTNREVVSRADELRSAIETIESQDKDRFRLLFYWFCGLLSISLGALAFARLNPWVGMVGMITGFTEMAFWTSPLWRSRGPQQSFEHLLTLKLVLSLASTLLLLGLWLWRERRRATIAPGAGSPTPTPTVG